MEHQNSFDQMEEDVILLNHSDTYENYLRRLRVQWMDHIYSFNDELEDVMENNQNHDFLDMVDTVGKDLELLRLYIAVEFSILAEEGKRRGLPEEITSQFLRIGLLKLKDAKSAEEFGEVAGKIVQYLHKRYIEFYSGSYSPLVKEAVNQIHYYKRRPVSLSKIAETLHVNASHLSRVFHKETGKTISEYILMVKMDWAKYLIDSEIYTLSEISQQLGYSSYSYFSQRFKKYFDISPEQYVKLHKNKNI